MLYSDIQKILDQAGQLSDDDLRKTAFEILKLTGYPHSDFLPGMDISREGLLNLIAGVAAIANTQVITIKEPTS